MGELIKQLIQSGKVHHVLVGCLFLMLSTAVFHVYAQQDKMATGKADNITIAQMLEQNQALIDLQRQSQQLQADQHRLATDSLLSLESRMLQANANQESEVLKLRYEQMEIRGRVDKNLETNAAILKQLNELSSQLKVISKAVE